MLYPRRAATRPFLLACSFLLLLFFSGCADKIKSNLIAFKALEEGLTNSNKVIYQQSRHKYSLLEAKMHDEYTVEKAKVWQPKASACEKISANMIAYIDSLKTELKEEAGLKTSNGIESFRESDKNAVMRLLEKKDKAKELYEKLEGYEKELLGGDPGIAKAFGRSIFFISKSSDSKVRQQDFYKTFFDDAPTIAALAVLSKFQNDVRIIENKIVNFCDEHAVK